MTTQGLASTSRVALFRECGLGMLGFVGAQLAVGAIVLAASWAMRGDAEYLCRLVRDPFRSPALLVMVGLWSAGWTLFWARHRGMRIALLKVGPHRAPEVLLAGALVGSVLCMLAWRVGHDVPAPSIPQRELALIVFLEWTWLLAGIVVAALGEEVFFRGYLQERIAAVAGAGAAISVSTLLFCLVHFLGMPWELAVLSAACGVLAAHWGLGPAVTCHAAWNVAARWSAAVPFPHAGTAALWFLVLATLLAFSARRAARTRVRGVSVPGSTE